jgi:hypothetical protein
MSEAQEEEDGLTGEEFRQKKEDFQLFGLLTSWNSKKNKVRSSEGVGGSYVPLVIVITKTTRNWNNEELVVGILGNDIRRRCELSEEHHTQVFECDTTFLKPLQKRKGIGFGGRRRRRRRRRRREVLYNSLESVLPKRRTTGECQCPFRSQTNSKNDVS